MSRSFDDILKPLVIVLGSYRGYGKTFLEDLCEHLRLKGFRIYTVAGYFARFPEQAPVRESECSEDAYDLAKSKLAMEKSDIVIFVLFRPETISVPPEEVPSMDQAITIELMHLLQLSSRPFAFFYDSEIRRKSMSSLMRALYEPKCKLFCGVVIDANSTNEFLNQLKKEVRGYCQGTYTDYFRKVKPTFTLEELLIHLQNDP